MSIPHLPKNISAEWELNSKLWQTWDYLYMVKGEAFREEREWRLVVTALQQNDAPPFQFRLSRGIVIPFLEYTMPDRSDHNGISRVPGPKESHSALHREDDAQSIRSKGRHDMQLPGVL